MFKFRAAKSGNLYATMRGIDREAVLKNESVRAMIDDAIIAVGKITETVFAGDEVSVVIKIVDKEAKAAIANEEFAGLIPTATGLCLAYHGDTAAKFVAPTGRPSDDLRKFGVSEATCAKTDEVFTLIDDINKILDEYFDEPLPCGPQQFRTVEKGHDVTSSDGRDDERERRRAAGEAFARHQYDTFNKFQRG